MWSDALAQGTAPAAAPGSPLDPLLRTLVPMGPFLLLLIVMYFLLIRPQAQQQKNQKKMLSELKKGDRVLTTGGIIGTVVGVDDGKAVLRVAEDVKLEFAKSAIVQVMPETKS